MPEEINLVAADAAFNILFKTGRDADANLVKQGIQESQSTSLATGLGGIQEEAIVLGVHCLTSRENTER